jgi:hypothetical protein
MTVRSFTGIRWEDRYDNFKDFPEHVLFSLARNESCPLEYRRFVHSLMVEKGYKSAEHPIFRELGYEVVETETEPVIAEEPSAGPLKAGFTTANFFGHPDLQITDDSD